MRNAELLEQEKRDKENELIKLITLLSDIEDMGRLSEVGQEIRKLQGEIKNLCNKIGNKKEICQSCWIPTKQKQKKDIGFRCVICKEEFSGQPLLRHIANYLDEGIQPKIINPVCQECDRTKVIGADFYCPRVSDGRDVWDPNTPKFDCYCPVPEEKR